MADYLFNFTAGDRETADTHLRAKRWEVGRDERVRDALAPGDRVLIYVAGPGGGFIGRAEIADDSPSGVVLADVERWDRAVPLATVVARVDPAGSNPVVQANARVGFRRGVVRLTLDEYETAVAVSREYQRP
jgi:hypothetical protein